MDPLDDYRRAIESILMDHTKIPYAHGDIRSETVFDRTQDRYLLVTTGWDGKKRIHSCLVHIDIIDGKLWIHYDGTEHGVAGDLVEAGVPKDRIVLAFHPPWVRQHTGYAVA